LASFEFQSELNGLGGIEQRWAPPSEAHSRRLIAVVGAMSGRANEHKGTRKSGDFQASIEALNAPVSPAWSDRRA